MNYLNESDNLKQLYSSLIFFTEAHHLPITEADDNLDNDEENDNPTLGDVSNNQDDSDTNSNSKDLDKDVDDSNNQLDGNNSGDEDEGDENTSPDDSSQQGQSTELPVNKDLIEKKQVLFDSFVTLQTLANKLNSKVEMFKYNSDLGSTKSAKTLNFIEIKLDSIVNNIDLMINKKIVDYDYTKCKKIFNKIKQELKMLTELFLNVYGKK